MLFYGCSGKLPHRNAVSQAVAEVVRDKIKEIKTYDMNENIRKKLFITVMIIILSGFWLQASAQESGILNRLQAINNGGTDFYNVDGVNVTHEVFRGEFTKANILRREYGHFIPGESALVQSDSSIAQRNYMYDRVNPVCEGVTYYTTYYFIEQPEGCITAIAYTSPGKNDKALQRELNQLILEKKIPASVFNRLVFNTINFAGRKIELSYSCQWANTNSVQWPYHGQMSWSVHRDREDAELSLDMQRRVSAYDMLNPGNAGAENNEAPAVMISDEEIDVIFEGVPAKARKIVFRSGTELEEKIAHTRKSRETKDLTTYYVVAPVRGYWVSCVMSHWYNDIIEESGLPELLEKVMKLK